MGKPDDNPFKLGVPWGTRFSSIFRQPQITYSRMATVHDMFNKSKCIHDFSSVLKANEAIPGELAVEQNHFRKSCPDQRTDRIKFLGEMWRAAKLPKIGGSACHRLVSWHLQHPTPAIVKLDLSRKIDGQMVKWRYLEMADPTLGASHLVNGFPVLYMEYPWNIPTIMGWNTGYIWLYIPTGYLWPINVGKSCQQGHRQQLSGPILWRV